MDVQKLHHLELSLSEPTKFKVGSEAYETVIQQHKEKEAFVLPNKDNEIKLVCRETAGTISIVEDVLPLSQNNQIPLVKKAPVEPPQDLRQRHPIYGKGVFYSFHSATPFAFLY